MPRGWLGSSTTMHATLAEETGRTAARLTAAEDRLDASVSKTAVLRYDAFNETSGRQSSTVALLDDLDNGVVISAILQREQARVYAKPIVDGHSSLDLSPEELAAMQQARRGPEPDRPGAVTAQRRGLTVAYLGPTGTFSEEALRIAAERSPLRPTPAADDPRRRQGGRGRGRRAGPRALRELHRGDRPPHPRRARVRHRPGPDRRRVRSRRPSDADRRPRPAARPDHDRPLAPAADRAMRCIPARGASAGRDRDGQQHLGGGPPCRRRRIRDRGGARLPGGGGGLGRVDPQGGRRGRAGERHQVRLARPHRQPAARPRMPTLPGGRPSSSSSSATITRERSSRRLRCSPTAGST